MAIYTFASQTITADTGVFNFTDLQFTQYTDGVNGAILKGWTYDPISTYLTCPADGLYLVTCTVCYGPNNFISTNSTIGRLMMRIVTDPVYPTEPTSYGAVFSKDTEARNNINLSYIFSLSKNNKIKIQLLYDAPGIFPFTVPTTNAHLTIHKIGNI